VIQPFRLRAAIVGDRTDGGEHAKLPSLTAGIHTVSGASSKQDQRARPIFGLLEANDVADGIDPHVHAALHPSQHWPMAASWRPSGIAREWAGDLACGNEERLSSRALSPGPKRSASPTRGSSLHGLSFRAVPAFRSWSDRRLAVTDGNAKVGSLHLKNVT